MRQFFISVALLGVLGATIAVGGNFALSYSNTSKGEGRSLVASANIPQEIIEQFRVSPVLFPEAPRVLEFPVPTRINGIPELELEARAVYAVEVKTGTVLLEKNARTSMQVASLTKLVTALTVVELIPSSSVVTVSPQAVAQDGVAGDLKAGEVLRRDALLAAMLIPSSNDAAWALAEYIGVPIFIAAMNRRTKTLGLGETAHFVNPHGIDADGHHASAIDIATFLNFAIKDPVLAPLLSTKDYKIKNEHGRLIHSLKTTNELLGRLEGIVGAKTGFTDEARGALAIAFYPVIKNRETIYRDADTSTSLDKALDRSLGINTSNDSLVILVVLGSPDRFSETEALIRWIQEAYRWK